MKDNDYEWVVRMLNYTIKDINVGMIHNHVEQGVIDGINEHLNRLLKSIQDEQRRNELEDRLSKCRDDLRKLRNSCPNSQMLDTLARIRNEEEIAKLRVMEQELRDKLNGVEVPTKQVETKQAEITQKPKMNKEYATFIYYKYRWAEFYDLSIEQQQQYTEAGKALLWYREHEKLPS